MMQVLPVVVMYTACAERRKKISESVKEAEPREQQHLGGQRSAQRAAWQMSRVDVSRVRLCEQACAAGLHA